MKTQEQIDKMMERLEQAHTRPTVHATIRMAAMLKRLSEAVSKC